MKLLSGSTLKLFSKKWSEFDGMTVMDHGIQSCLGPSLVPQRFWLKTDETKRRQQLKDSMKDS